MEGTNYPALTGERPVDDHFKYALGEVRRDLEAMERSAVLAALPEELLAHYVATYWAVDIIEMVPGQAPEIVKDTSIGRTVEMHLVPRESNPRTLRLRASSWPYALAYRPQFLFRVEDHVLIMHTLPPSVVQVRQGIDYAQKAISYISEDVTKYAGAFRKEVARMIDEQKARIQRDAQAEARFDEELQSLGLILKKRPEAVVPVNVAVKKSVEMLRQLPSQKPTPGEAFVNPDAVREIVTLIDQTGKNFEIAPATYNKLGEEDLRNIIVATLNAVFESNIATGETFSRLGKTDIRLNVPAGDVLIAECKVWGGQSEYGSKNIKQLFGYLTHRHSIGMLITFVRTKGLAEIVDRAAEATMAHPSYRSNHKMKAPTHFVSVHEHPTNSALNVEVHHLFFHLYATDS